MNRKKVKFAIVLAILGVVLVVGAIFILSRGKLKEAKIEVEEIVIQDFQEDQKTDPLSLLSASVVQTYKTASLQKRETDKLTLSKKGDGNFEPKRLYTSEVLSSKMGFNAVGPHWIEELPDGTKIDLEMRIKDTKNKWSQWMKVEKAEAGKEVKEEETFGELIFIESGKDIQYRVQLETSNPKITPLLDDLKFTFIDSTRGPKVKKVALLDRLFNIARAAGRPRIISRREWGCDESLMFWNPEYYPVSALVLHHTAGWDGGSNPAAVVRGIYYYHAVTRRWGDIGYNFLVDKYGNIYEGRSGGEGVIAAHAYDEINRINYNRGSIGVAVLGSYGSYGISYKAKQALSKLSASLLYDFNLGPTSWSRLQGKRVPTVCAHRDLEPTQCPGGRFYSQISSIRSLAGGIQRGFGAKVYKGRIVSKVRKSLRVKIAVKNLSNFVWHNYTKNAARIVSGKKQIAKMKETNVAPGQIAHFSFRLGNKPFSIMIGKRKIGGGGTVITSSLPRVKSAVFSKTNTIVLNFDKSLSNIRVRKSQFRVKVGSKTYPILKVRKKGKQLRLILAERIGYKLTPKVSYISSGGWRTIKAQNKIKDSPDLVNFLVSKRNSSNEIKTFNREGKTLSSFWAYRPEFRIGVSLALGDVDGDGEEEIVVGAGKRGGPHIRVLEKNGKYTGWDVFAFDRNFRKGINVATGDVDGDGIDEIGVCQAQGGHAWCKVYKYNKQKTILGEWNAFGNVECGASIAMGDVNGDGKAEVIVGAGPGNKPQVKVFDAQGRYLGWELIAFHPDFSKGINVAAGDVDLDGRDEIGVCQKTSGHAWCKVYKYNKQKAILGEWNAYGNVECGASIDLADINGDGKDEVITSPGPGYKPQIRTFSSSGKALNYGFFTFGKAERVGFNLALKNN